MKKIITCLLTALGLTSACGQKNYESVDVHGFAKLIADPSVIILDVRTAVEYADGHIQGAILVDQGQSDFVEKAKVAIACGQARFKGNAAASTETTLAVFVVVGAVLPTLPGSWLLLDINV